GHKSSPNNIKPVTDCTRPMLGLPAGLLLDEIGIITNRAHSDQEPLGSPDQTWANSTKTRTACSISSRQVHSKGECGLCSPVKRFGVGTPSSVNREPSVPPRTLSFFGINPVRAMAFSR